uniref:NADH dehydrogenase subunit 6 n=1 Tax=Peltoperlopsis sagittata TaxID=2969800 RepID=UPI002176C346|nr:NADH dehydrogenase subunit 6 [Peltoperlopsis sagittata]UUK29395.1 NADH dehydrogenase subunit 6 [Peltoperlopsis sagittata]
MLNLIIMTASLSLALTFVTMNHPLAMGIMLLLQTLVICLITGLISQSYWFSYILFLVFLSGLLILFIYVSSLASNEMFSLSSPYLFMNLIPLTLVTLTISLTDPMPWMNNILNSDTMFNLLTYSSMEETSQSLLKLYNQPTSMITLMLVIYLLLTLVIIVKITSIFQGPLRQKN